MVSAVPAVARADTAVSLVQVACLELEPESRAAIEARQLGELKTRGGAPGVLRLECETAAVKGSWSVEGRLVAERSLSRHEGEDPKELLHWLASMLLETREERARAGIDDVAAAAANKSVADSPLSSSETLENGALPPPTRTSPEEELSDAEQARPTVQDPPGDLIASSEAIVDPSAVSEGSSREVRDTPEVESPQWPQFEVSVGGKYQHFGRQLAGTLGPTFAVGLRVRRPISVEAQFSPQFSVRRSADFAATDWTGGVYLCVDPTKYAGGCLGSVISALQVRSPSSATGDKSRSTTAGGEALVRLVAETRRTDYWVGFGLRALAARREVLLNESEIASIPHVQAVFAAGLRGNPLAK